MILFPARNFRIVLLLGFLFGCVLSPALADWQFAAGDADRDALDDLALIGNGEWYVWMSGQNYAMEGAYDLDLSGGLYAVGDLDDDRRADLTMLSGAEWHIWRSGNNYVREGPFDCGVANGVPYLFDFDHDGKDDPCVVVGFTWHVWDSGKNYSKRPPFVYNPGSSTELIPVAWCTRKLWQGQLIITQYVGYMKDGLLPHWLHWRDNKYYGNFLTSSRLVQGIPVRGRFDGHKDDDLLVIQRRPDSFWFYTWFSGDNFKQSGPYQLKSGNVPGVAAMVWQDTAGCYAAALVYDIGDITKALVTVNGTPLVYNRKLSFTTSAGRPASLNLPFYYAELPNVKTGDEVTCSVFIPGPSGPTLMYRSKPTTMPGQVQVLEPPDGACLVINDPVQMSWTAAAGARGYLVSYDVPDDYTPSKAGGGHIDYLEAPKTSYTIPANMTVKGRAEFEVAAMNGDVQALIGPEDTNDSLLVTASWDKANALVSQPVTDPLFIAKEYSIKEGGLCFNVRESDPYKMPHPGTVTINFRLRRWRLSVAFVAAYDMQGNPYFAWDKARVYKRKNKSYTVTFPCKAGSTIVIGTHHASFRGASYRYGSGKFFDSRDMIVYPTAGTGDFGQLWTGRSTSLWSGVTPGFLIDSGDYNGDGTSDLAIFRFSSGLWAIREITRAYFGSADDLPTPGDYNGDGTTDLAVFRLSSGLWAVSGGTRVFFGSPGDLPVPGDYNGDGATDIGIFRESSGLWAIRGVTRTYLGSSADIPVPGYYAPDGRKSIGVFRPASGLWAIRDVTRAYFGTTGDSPVPGDYNGDWIWDLAVFRPSSGLWAIRGMEQLYFGGDDGFPIPGVYAGNGSERAGFFRPASGLWAIPGVTRAYFGSGIDVPVTR